LELAAPDIEGDGKSMPAIVQDDRSIPRRRCRLMSVVRRPSCDRDDLCLSQTYEPKPFAIFASVKSTVSPSGNIWGHGDLVVLDRN
jgi:hypothetical protein